MLDAAQLARLSPLARRFREEFGKRHQDLARVEEITDRYELRVPAAHDEVGDLVVWDDGEELTISVGEHHWHIPLYMFLDEPEAQRVPLAAAAALEDIQDVLALKTVFRTRRRNGVVVSTTSYSLDLADTEPPSAEDREYLWTGPRFGRA